MLATALLGFLIGLSGALAPGPTLIATIQGAVRGGWKTGPKVTAGHMAIEIGVFVLVVMGVSTAVLRFSREIALVGGISLVVFGLLTIRGSREGYRDEGPLDVTENPYIAGFLTGVTNPYFWIWWLTIGSALILSSLEQGIALAIAFMLGHWGADLGWYTLVSGGIQTGRNFLASGGYRTVLLGCGALLVVFGVYYLTTAFTLF